MLNRWKRMAGVVLVAAMVAGPVWGEEAPRILPAPVKPGEQVKPANPAKVAKPPVVKESATDPKPRPGKWMERHEAYLKEAKENAGKVDLLFVGDSITDGWHNPAPKGGKEVWETSWVPLKAHNIGIGGDRTQHVLWRLQNGEVEGIKPKLTVLMIGTNNITGLNTDEEIVAGVTACVKEIQKQMAGTKILLLAIFPRSAAPDHAYRGRIKAINTEIAKLDDGGKTVKYLDIGEKFLDSEGNLPKEIMPDALHPNAKGYEIWAEAVQPSLDELMKDSK